MGFFDFLQPVERGAASAGKATLSFLNRDVAQPIEKNFVDTGKNIANSPLVQGFRFLGDTASRVVGGGDQAEAAQRNAITRGLQGPKDVLNQLKDTKHPENIAAFAGPDALEVSSPLVEEASTKGTAPKAPSIVQSKVEELQNNLRDKQTSNSSISREDLQKLADSKTPSEAHTVLKDKVAPEVADKVAPAIAQTTDRNIISNILDNANKPTDVAAPLVDTIANPAHVPEPVIPTEIAPTTPSGLREATVPQPKPTAATTPEKSVVTNPELRAALDNATKPTDVNLSPLDEAAKVKKTAAGIRTDYSGELNAQKLAGQQLADTIHRIAPGEEKGIFWYNEAKGDVGRLQLWADEAQKEGSPLAPHLEDIQQAQNLSDNAKESAAALNEYYDKAGKNAVDQGTIKSLKHDYGNARLYEQEASKTGASTGDLLKQTTDSGKARQFDTVAEAIYNGKKPLTTDAADLVAIHNGDLARSNSTNNLLQKMVDSGLATAGRSGEKLAPGMVDMGGLRALAQSEKEARIDLYSQAKDLRPIQSLAERLVTTRSSWVRKLSSEVNRLNKEGLDIALSKTKETTETGNAFKYNVINRISNPETTANNRGIHDVGAAQSITGQLKTDLAPGRGASIKETRSIVNDLVNLPDGKIEMIKSKIATRENKLGPILDDIASLKNTIDGIKTQRKGILEEARGIDSPTRAIVPEELANRLRAITEPDFVRRVDGWRKLSAYQGMVKTVDLSFSLFHHITEAAQFLYNTKLGTDVLRNTKGLVGKLDTPEFAAAEQDFAKHGGITTKIEGIQDIVRGLTDTKEGAINKFKDAPGVKQVFGAADKFSAFLFDKAQRFIKVTDYQNKITKWMEKNPDATPEEFKAAKQGYAKEINAAYGGLNWQAIGVTKSMQSVLRGVLLAPDWVISNLQLAKYGVSGGTEGAAARGHIFTALASSTAATQALNYAINGHFTNENPKGHEFDVQLAPNVYVTLYRGGIGDLLKYAENIQDNGVLQGSARFTQGKLSPLARTAVGLLSGTEFTGQKINGPNDNFATKTGNELKFLATSLAPVPFGVVSSAKYINESHKTNQPINPAVVGSLASGVSRFSKTSSNLSDKQNATISQLAKQGASKEQRKAYEQYYLTSKKTSSDRTKASKAIDTALAKGDVQGAQKIAADYNAKYRKSFVGWSQKYGQYANKALNKDFNSGKINLTRSGIKARVKALKTNPLYGGIV